MKTNEPLNLPSNSILVMLSSFKSFYIQKKGCLTRLAWKQHDNSTSNSMQCSKSHKLSGGQRVKLLGLLLTKHKFLAEGEFDAKMRQSSKKISKQQMWNCKPATICGVWTDTSRREREDSFHGEKCKTKQKKV